MKKSISSRIKITKTGKLLRRKMAQDHFRAKKTGKQIRAQRSSMAVDSVDLKSMRRYIYSNLP